MKYCANCGGGNLDDANFCEKCGHGFKSHVIDVGLDKRAHIGKTCPFCQYVIKPGEKITVCPICGVPHHTECWIKNDNRCTTFDCAGSTNVTNKNVIEPQSFDSSISETNCRLVTDYKRMDMPTAQNITQSDFKKEKSHRNIVKYGIVIISIGLGVIYFNQTPVQPNKALDIKPAQQFPVVTTKIPVQGIRSQTLAITNSVVRQVVVDFYNQVRQKNYSVAWNYLSDDWKQSTSYSQWVRGYENTLSTNLDSAEIVGNVTEKDTLATVRVRLTSRDSQGSRVLAQTFSGNVTLTRNSGTKWSLAESDVKRENYWYE